MKQFEYHISTLFDHDDRDVVEVLNSYGANGWEVIHTEVFNNRRSTFILKRETERPSTPIFEVNQKHSHSIKTKCYFDCPYHGTPNEITARTF